MTEQSADPGYHDPDRSDAFPDMLRTLDHFNGAPYVKAARRALYRLLRPHTGARLLDAGCGVGLDVAALAARVGPTGHVVGLDISERFLAVARSRYGYLPGVEFMRGSIEHIDVPDGWFDAAFAMRTVQYMDDPSNAIAELVRVTRAGGRVVLVEGGMSTIDLPAGALAARVVGPRPTGPGIGARLPRLLRDAGLDRITVRPGFGVDLGRPDPMLLTYIRSVTENAVADGIATRAAAAAWLQQVDELAASGNWFDAECMFVVGGVVPRRPTVR